jgi:hypothetical protein
LSKYASFAVLQVLVEVLKRLMLSLPLQHVGNPSYSTCGQQGVAVKPRQGDALLFYSQTPNGTLDTLSLHSGCPVIRGNKWSATK